MGGRAAAHIGAFPGMLIGLLIGTIGFGSLVVLSSTTPYLLTAIISFIAGFGMAFAMPAATSAAVTTALPSYTGVTSGVINAAWQTSSVFGAAVLGSMIAGKDSFLVRFHQTVGTSSAVFAVAAAVVPIIRVTTLASVLNKAHTH